MIFSKKNQLTFLRQNTYHGRYSHEEKFKKESIKKILTKFKKDVDTKDNVSIISKFNGIQYPIYDLDTKDNLDLFKKLNSDIPYIILKSSEESGMGSGKIYSHYWGILDVPYKNIKNIFTEHTWKICNDPKYVKFCNNYNYLIIRGLYESYDRKPLLYESNGDLSSNFGMFIDKILKFYSNESFELSVLRYKNTDFLQELIIRKRKDKIEKILSRGNK